MKVYLAGGMKSGWQNTVKAACPDHEFIDPRTHGLTDERAYTEWDLLGVANADVIFGYLEHDNPSGYGLCVEFGYGHALGKKIIFVQDARFPKLQSFGMARSIASEVHQTLDDGIASLRAKFTLPAPTPTGDATLLPNESNRRAP